MKTALEYITGLEATYAGEPWFGESFQTKMKDVSEAQAFQKPKAGEHSIAEIVAHMTFWRNAVVNKLEGGSGGEFTAENPENWPALEELKKRGWKSIKASFDQTQSSLVKALKQNPALPGDVESALAGTMEHDIYHLGQIGYLKKLI